MPIVIVDADGNGVYANPAFAQMLGYTLAQVPTWAAWEEKAYPDPVYRAVVHDEMQRLLESVRTSGQVAVGQIRRLTTAGGMPRIVQESLSPLGDTVVITMTDLTERDATNRVLVQTAAELEGFFALSLDMLCIASTDGRFLRLNPAWKRVLGYEVDELVGVQYLDYVHPDDVASTRRAMGELVDQREVVGFANRYRAKDGTYRWLEWVSRPMGNVVYAIAHDVTQARLAAEQLRAGEHRFRSLFEHMAEGVALHDLVFDDAGRPIDYRILDVNPAYERHTGLRREVAQGRCGRAVYQTDYSPYFAEFSGVALSGKAIEFETFFAPLERHFRVSVVSPGPHQFATVFEDITGRKRDEAALAAEKERLLVTLRSIGDGVITTDTAGNITLMNLVAEQLTGWVNADALGRPLTEVFRIVNETSRQTCENPVTKVLRSGNIEALANHTVLLARDGGERIIADSAAPIRGNDGSIIGVVLVFRDTTDKQKTEDALRSAQKLESLGVLAGGIAHDFNNLLSGLFGYIDLARLACEPHLDSPTAQHLEKALSVFGRARDLTQQLLTFAKGSKPLKKLQALEPIVRNAGRFVLSGSNIELTMHFAPDLWPVDVDENQISQVIDNVVINARQAMPTGGTLTVNAANLAGDAALPPGLPAGRYVVVSLADNGPGIAREHLARVFEPFFTTKQTGSGLGLAIAYSVMRKHGGAITIDADLGRGTRITLYLPAATLGVAAAAAAAPATFVGRGRVLLMDDEPAVREVGRVMLQKLGFDVTVAAHGDAALAAVRDELAGGRRFAAILLDLTVPGRRGGGAIIGELRQLDAQVPVIASSGYSDDPIMDRPKEHGFSACLGKPYLLADLQRLLHSLLGGGPL